MSKLIKGIFGAILTVVGLAVPGLQFLTGIGLSLVGSALRPTPKGREREASAATLQIGEYPRTAVFGRAALAGSLVDAFNYGGTYGTDWELLVIALADHRCDALEGFYVNDTYVAFAGDGDVAGYNSQLKVFWRSGTETQAVPSILLTSLPAAGWTSNDNGAGVCYVVVAYKADAEGAQSPVWPGGRPRFKWVLRGALCYDARLDSTVAGGAGAHRWNDPATRAWSENVLVCRYNWARGLFACDRVTQPDQLLIGRGLSEVEAPPTNLAWRANVCDESVGGAPRYRCGGLVASTETYLSVEEDFAAACAGTIVQPEGAVEIDPGEARAPSFAFTDRDLVVGSPLSWREYLGVGDADWINTVVPSYIEPAQNWEPHAAPIRRDAADVTADRGSRELALSLGFVSNGAQAGRIGEIHRRLGRLQGRAQVTLPPRFCGIEEGDWGTWQSDRHFGGATLTFRVEAWGSDEGWRHQLTLRQISASAYDDNAPLTDGSTATQQAARAAIAAPAGGTWTLAAGQLSGGGIKLPALILTGASDQAVARFVRVEYVQQAGAPGVGTVWTADGVFGPEVVRREIAGAPGGTYYVSVSYVVDGFQGPRLVLGPVTLGSAAYPGGTPIETLQPGEGGSTSGDNQVFNSTMAISTANQWWGSAARIAGNPAANEPTWFARSTSAGGQGGSFNGGALIQVVPQEEIFVSAALRDATQAPNNFWRFNPFFYKADGVTFISQAVVDLPANSATFAQRKGKFPVPAGAAFMILNITGIVNAGASVDCAYPRFARTETQADVTMLVTGGRALSVAFDYAGAAKTGELPIDIPFKLILSDTTDVTAMAAWTATLKSGTATYTMGAATGVLNVTALSADAVIEAKATYQSKERTSTASLVRKVDPPPASGSGGGTSDSSSISATGQGSSYGAAAGRILTVTPGSGGQVDVTITSEFYKQTAGSVGAYGKAQWRAVGGSFADVAAETASSSSATRTGPPEPDNTAGNLSFTATKTGLTPGTPYEFQFLPRSAGAAIDLNGTQSGVGS